MQGRKHYGGLDLFRITAAFLVVAIHTSPLSSLSPAGDFFLTRILARVAVPFFLMVTGQFLPGGFWNDSKNAPAASGQPFAVDFFAVKKYLFKIAGLYGISVLLYFPIGLYAGHYEDVGPLNWLRLLIFDGTFYHLWYFPACMLGVLLVWLLSRRLSLKAATGIAAALYVIGLFGDSYYGLIAKVPVVSDFYEGMFRISSYTRNGLFFAPLFLLMGVHAKKDLENSGRAAKKAVPAPNAKGLAAKKAVPAPNAKGLAAGFFLSLALMTVEGFTLRHFSLQRHDSMYLSLVPCMYFLYRLLLSQKGAPCRSLRTVAAWIYILHPAMIVLVRGGAKVLGLTGFFVENSLVYFFTVSLSSLAAAICITLGWNFCKKKPSPTGRAWVELDRKALSDNVAALRAALPDNCKLMPVLKANAYGHGAVPIARELSRLGVRDFCVASLSEGITLRKAGIRGNILILGYTHPKDFSFLRRYRLTQTVIDKSYALKLNQYGKKLAVHIAIDTGMHRLGISCKQPEALKEIYKLKHLAVKGLFTHLCTSDGSSGEEIAFTNRQALAFYRAVQRLKEEGLPCPGLHLLASYGIRNFPQYAEDYARVGIALYGVWSRKEELSLPLRPVLSLKSRVAAIRELAPGETAGYGLAFTASRPTKIAVLSIGYADGLPRSLSCGNGSVLLNGHPAPIIGRICMDQTLVDATDIPCLYPGAEAVLIGRSAQKEITAGDLAAQCDTITNEILSRMGERLERILV